jgi:FlaA1/EpsC-like NDP-sugar epimerase
MMEAGTATREKVLDGHASPAEATAEQHAWAAGGTIVARGYGHRDFWTRRLLALADVTGLLLALLLSAVSASQPHLGSHLVLGAATLPAWIVIFKAYGLYDRDAKRVSHGTVDDLPWLFHALLVGALLSWLYYKLVGEQVPLAEGVTFGVTALAFILMLRFAVRSLGKHVLPGERVLLVGEEKITDVLVRKMRAHPEYGLDPVGVIRVSRHARTPALPVVGDLGDLRGVVREGRIERIVVSALDLDATDTTVTEPVAEPIAKGVTARPASSALQRDGASRANASAPPNAAR